MKKILVFIILLVFVISSFAFSSCDKDENSENGASTNSLKIVSSEETVLSFESYSELLGYFTVDSSRAEFCEDSNFVKDGKKSMHLLVEGEYDTYNACPYFILYTDNECFNEGDFSKYDFVGLSVYNDNEKDLNIEVWMQAYDNYSNISSTIPVNYLLKAKSWNKIVYDFSDSNLKKQFNNMNHVYKIYVSFKEYKQNKDDELTSFYFDNVTLGLFSKQEMAVERKENEIVDFEDIKDLNCVSVSSDYVSTFLPRLSINTSANYVTSGKNSLCVEYRNVVCNKIKATNTESRYYQIQFDMKLFDRPTSSKKVKFDVYNSENSVLYINAFCVTSLSNVVSNSINLQPHKWTSVEIDQEDIAYFGIKFLQWQMAMEEKSVFLYYDNFMFA